MNNQPNVQYKRKSGKGAAIIASVIVLLIFIGVFVFGYFFVKDRLSSDTDSKKEDYSELFEKADELVANGKIDVAIELIEKRLEKDPDSKKLKRKLEEYEAELVSAEQNESSAEETEANGPSSLLGDRTHTEDVTAVETTPVETSLPTEVTLPDGSREVYVYDESGNIISKIQTGVDGEFIARYAYGYADGVLAREKSYNEAGSLVLDTTFSADGTKTVIERLYDENEKMTSGTSTVYRADGSVSQLDTLNMYDAAVSTKLYDEQGKLILTREYHFTTAGYGDGYTDTDAKGKKTRYNEDGSVRKDTPKPTQKPASTTTAKTTAATTKATTTPAPVVTAAPEPLSPTYIEATDWNAVNQMTEKTYNRADNALLKVVVYGKYNGQKMVIESTDYQTHKKEKIERMPDGSVIKTFIYEFNYNPANYTKETIKDSSGKVTKVTGFERDPNGRISKKIYYLTDGVTVEKYEVYNYSISKEGVTTYTTSTFDASGKLLSTSKPQRLY